MQTSGPTNNAWKFDLNKARVKQPFSTSALHTAVEECVFCKKNHKSINCISITEPKARRTVSGKVAGTLCV